MKANVTMPDMQISTDVLDFQEVRCGECKVITVQLHNHKPVKCEWNSLPTESERRKVSVHCKSCHIIFNYERSLCQLFGMIFHVTDMRGSIPLGVIVLLG